MPLNAKGREIKKNMVKEYGPKKGEEVFYASENKGTIHGVTKKQHEKQTTLKTKKHEMVHKMMRHGPNKGMTSLSRK